MIETASVVLAPEGAAVTPYSDSDETVRTHHRELSGIEEVSFPPPEELAAVRKQFAADEAPTIVPATLPAARGNEGASALLFGRYRVERELGRGGMGVVSLAQDEVLGIPVALKLVPEELARSADDLEGLRKEVLRGIALTHPGIVRVYSFERQAASAAIVMEYVDGESLAELKARQPDRCFDPKQLRPWLEQLCAVLDYAHGEARIAHRDLKPRNLMITREGRLKVADFGIASSLSETLGGISVRNDSSGTPPYMSPQQAMGDRPTIGDDIYSVGATLYDLLTSKPPFYRGNVIAQVLQEAPAPMNARRAELEIAGRPEIPAQWERVVAACLAKSPGERPPNGAALLQLLDTAPHALVPYAPREVISLESMKLDLVRIERPEPDTAELIEEAIEVRPARRHQYVEILEPEQPGFLSAVGETLAGWGRRLVQLAIVAALIMGVLYLAKGWNHMQQQTRPVVVFSGGPHGVPQAAVVEVRYVHQAGPPPMGPPPGWAPPAPPPGMPLPPHGGPHGGPPPRGPR
jgi:serine/threonine protein kinase